MEQEQGDEATAQDPLSAICEKFEGVHLISDYDCCPESFCQNPESFCYNVNIAPFQFISIPKEAENYPDN